MRIRITANGIYGAGPLEIGTEFELANVPPPGWAGKYIVIDDDPKKGKKAVVNPAKDDAPIADPVVVQTQTPEADAGALNVDVDADVEDKPRRGRPRKDAE